MSQIMARVRVCSGLTRYRSFRTLLTCTGGSSNRVLDGAFQASSYSRSAESKVMDDPMFIESSAHYASSRQAARISPISGAASSASSRCPKLEVHNSLLNVVLYDKPEIKTREAS